MNEYLLEKVRASGGIETNTLVLPGDVSAEDVHGAVTTRRAVQADDRTWQQAVPDARSLTASQAGELQYQKRIFPDGAVYFVRNAGPDYCGEIRIMHSGTLELWNVDTGAIQSVPIRTEGEFVVAQVSIPAADALLTACVDASTAPRYRPRGEPVASTELKGPWSLTARKTRRTRGIESDVSLEIPRLLPWREIPQLHDLAGTVGYRTEFTYTPAAGTQLVVLQLGEVSEAARSSSSAPRFWTGSRRSRPRRSSGSTRCRRKTLRSR
jgi:hypothetical protein